VAVEAFLLSNYQLEQRRKNRSQPTNQRCHYNYATRILSNHGFRQVGCLYQSKIKPFLYIDSLDLILFSRISSVLAAQKSKRAAGAMTMTRS